MDSMPLGLVWGVKRTFIEYVRRMPDGKGWIGDGARPLSDDRIYFGFDPAASGAKSWTFRGDVRFSGHLGMLFVRLAHPVISRNNGHASLTIDNPSGKPEDDRLELVTMSLDLRETKDGIDYWHSTETKLAPAGVELFNDVYPVGEEFEPVMLVVPASEPVEAQN